MMKSRAKAQLLAVTPRITQEDKLPYFTSLIITPLASAVRLKQSIWLFARQQCIE